MAVQRHRLGTRIRGSDEHLDGSFTQTSAPAVDGRCGADYRRPVATAALARVGVALPRGCGAGVASRDSGYASAR